MAKEEEKKLKDTRVHGHKVYYDEDSYPGIVFLKTLDNNEDDPFFEYARRHGECSIRASSARRFNLVFKGSNTYILERR